MAEVNKELEQMKAEADAAKAELKASKVETETAKAEADAAKAELEALKAEIEKMKAKETKKNKNAVNPQVEKQEEELVQVFLIKTKEKKEDFFCAINGHTYQIKRGEYVEVPKSVREVIKHQNQMDQVAMENLEKANKNFAEEK